MKVLIGTNTFGDYKRQTIAMDSLKHLKEYFPKVVDVIDIQFEDEADTFENVYELDVKFDLTRSSLDVVNNAEKKLPFVNDLFSCVSEYAADYFIFANSDVIINKSLIEYIIEHEPACMACSRMDINDIDSFLDIRTQAKPIRWEIAGFDVFVFKKSWYEQYKHMFHDYLLGKPMFDSVYAGIIKCFGDNTPLGNQNPPFCFHIHHGIGSVTTDCPERQFNLKTAKSNPMDTILDNITFFNLKHNLCRRTPWLQFLSPSKDELKREKVFFDIMNVHVENKL